MDKPPNKQKNIIRKINKKCKIKKNKNKKKINSSSCLVFPFFAPSFLGFSSFSTTKLKIFLNQEVFLSFLP
jgi:hypothetical protein